MDRHDLPDAVARPVRGTGLLVSVLLILSILLAGITYGAVQFAAVSAKQKAAPSTLAVAPDPIR